MLAFVSCLPLCATIVSSVLAPANGQALDERVRSLENRMAVAEARLDVLRAGAARPSAHLDGSTTQLVDINRAVDTTFWSTTSPRSHLKGGFTYANGQLRVPQTGRYFVYAQVWNHQLGGARHFILNNERRLAVAGANTGHSQSTWAGGVFSLSAGDKLSVRLLSGSTGSTGATRVVWPGGAHTYFGAFRV